MKTGLHYWSYSHPEAPEAIAPKLARCEAEGRDYDSIAKTVAFGPGVVNDLDQFRADLAGYAALGVSEIQFMPDRDPAEFTRWLADSVLPLVADVA